MALSNRTASHVLAAVVLPKVLRGDRSSTPTIRERKCDLVFGEASRPVYIGCPPIGAAVGAPDNCLLQSAQRERQRQSPSPGEPMGNLDHGWRNRAPESAATSFAGREDGLTANDHHVQR